MSFTGFCSLSIKVSDATYVCLDSAVYKLCTRRTAFLGFRFGFICNCYSQNVHKLLVVPLCIILLETATINATMLTALFSCRFTYLSPVQSFLLLLLPLLYWGFGWALHNVKKSLIIRPRSSSVVKLYQ